MRVAPACSSPPDAALAAAQGSAAKTRVRGIDLAGYTGLPSAPFQLRDPGLRGIGVGPCSSVFDYTTFLMMMFVFKALDPSRASLFQTGWFVESLLTQTLIIHVIRTSRIPFLQTRASLPLTLTTLSIMALGVWLPYSPFASALGFTGLPPLYWPLLLTTLLLYVLLTQAVKMWLLKKAWI